MAEAGDGFIGGAWQAGHGDLIESHNPLDGTVVWRGRAADAAQVHRAVAAAKAAFGGWAGLSTGQRTDFLAGFTGLLEKHRAALAAAISVETGKPHWEAQAEISAMQGKFTIACRAYAVRRTQSRIDLPEATGYTRFRPHGAIAVFGPFNMPGHLPHGHILPALLAGNTIVFKPISSATMRCGNATDAFAKAAPARKLPVKNRPSKSGSFPKAWPTRPSP